ncbi:porin family protein [Photobacterium sp. TY1-4]|uniref:porin family protein n=1 Tax=Photobacterium sp. TY1-4 TaxID=2899122 RepID=UPI0021C23C63|nr:porin family protein [Photobacterium sp. TY1-4]UXI00049.1 porin family protein [Photobacterium sp. TY1-4]
MNKIALLPLSALMITAFSAQADNATQNFNFVSGGLQVSEYNHQLPTSVSSWGETTSDSTAGLYLRGSWNFTDQFFLEARSEGTVDNDLTISHSLLGLGYFQPINNRLTVYGLAGISGIEAELDVHYWGFSDGHASFSEDDSGLTGEVGARYQLMSNWTIEPAVRLAAYDDTMQEFRLGNNIQLTQHFSLEANLQHRKIEDLKETSYQLGARYSF